MAYDKKKAIKLFIEYKVIEILVVLGIILFLIFVPTAIGNYVDTKLFGSECNGDAFCEGIIGATSSMFLLIILWFIYLIILANWEKAKNNAYIPLSKVKK